VKRATILTAILLASASFLSAQNEFGADAQYARAAEDGLDWLLRHQHPGGYWACHDFSQQCNSADGCGGYGYPLNIPGVTGLAILAFLYSGEADHNDSYRCSVEGGINYLCAVQKKKDGCFVDKAGTHWMYNHAIATLALIEAFRVYDEKSLVKPIEKALAFIHESKNPGAAWRYNNGAADPTDQNDVSVTGWMVECLAKGRRYGFTIDTADLRDALEYINSMTLPATGRTGYNKTGLMGSREKGDEELWPFAESEAMTARAIVCRFHIGFALNELDKAMRPINSSAGLLSEKLPSWNESKGTIDYYYFFFGTSALRMIDGPRWARWKKAIGTALIDNQILSGCSKGSWDPGVDPWGDNGSRVYSTALCTMALCLCSTTPKSMVLLIKESEIQWPAGNKVFYCNNKIDDSDVHKWGCGKLEKTALKITISDARNRGKLPCLICCAALYKNNRNQSDARIKWPPKNKVFYVNADEEAPQYFHNAKHKPRCPHLNRKSAQRKIMTIKEAKKKCVLPCKVCCATLYMRGEVKDERHTSDN